MGGILVIGEIAGDAVSVQSLESASAALQLARQLDSEIHGAIFGPGDLSRVADQFQCGWSSLMLVESGQFSIYSARVHVAAAEAVVNTVKPSVVLFAHSARTRDWAPQLAAQLDAGIMLDCIEVAADEYGVRITKPMYGGGVLGQFLIHTRPALATLRGGVFNASECSSPVSLQYLALPEPTSDVAIRTIDSIAIDNGGGKRLKDAKKIVAGGRGIGARGQWHLIEEAASAMNAAVGCSRAIVDMGWLPWHYQVGLSGSQVAPDIYIAVGISGAVQHLSGISNAQTVVAINNDPDAEIFKRADYGIVADCREVLPGFIERVKQHHS